MGIIHPASIQEVLEKCQIDEVVKDFVSLQRRGTNYIGLCPFHNEKTPSFSVSPSKNIFKCFGCGKGGDSLHFIMELENLSFPDAIRYLANKYRIQLEETISTDAQKEEQKHLEALFLINDFAVNFYMNQLWESERGKNIGLSYFKHRDFREEIIKDFKLGFAPESGNAFTTEALKQGYSLEYLQKLGLTNNQGNDFFRGRVMFPISNMSGKVIAFAGRILTKDTKAPKYINSPETEIYQKSKTLFGMNFARKQIQKENECIITEGYTDVLSLHQAGLINVVAASGTSLTRDQIRIIKRLTENVLILFDGDSAGLNASIRGLGLTLEEDLNVRLVSLPEGEDPDSYIKKVGTSKFKEYLNQQAKNLVQFEMTHLMKTAGGDPNKRAAVLSQIAITISKVRNPLKRDSFVKICKDLLQIDESAILFEINRQLKKDLEKSTLELASPENEPLLEIQEPEKVSLSHGDEHQERDIARILILAGNQYMDKDNNLMLGHFIIQNMLDIMEGFEHHLYRQVVEIFLQNYQQGLSLPDATYFLNHDQQDLKNLAISFLISPYVFSENWEKKWDIFLSQKLPEENFNHDAIQSLKRFRFRKICKLINENSQELKKMNPSENEKLHADHIKLHFRLKEIQTNLAKELGIVVVG
jgi:DNA primase